MGHNSLRRVITSECKWTDKDAPKHKHNFCIEACVEMVQGEKNWVSYYHFMKCDCCNSLHSIPKEGAVNGFIQMRLPNLPLIKLYRSHKTIGFKGAILRDMHS